MGHIDEMLVSKAEVAKLDCKTAVTSFEYVTNPASDAGIVKCQSGREYWYGTATGIPGASDAANAVTFQLPSPERAGEKIVINFSNAAVINKILGVTVDDEANDNITYIATEDGSSVEVASTATGVHGTANTMVKIAAQHYLIGDKLECVSTSTTNWLMKVVSEGGTLAAGDIAPDPGNVGGYID
tara:strand:- start:55 stop:609 length:555 start_codon:yes stop_codon:yes gene_type:complete